jgi:hypothetical protein
MPIYSVGTPGFRVLIKSEGKYQKVIPKFQRVAISSAQGDFDKIAQIDYLHRELDPNTLLAILHQGGTKNCIPQDADLNTYVLNIAKEVNAYSDTASATANVKALGVMPLSNAKYGVSKGLSSVQITIGENGVYTDYNFEDKIVIPPSEDVVQGQLILQNRVNPVFGTSLQKISSQDYAHVTAANAQMKTANPGAYTIAFT